jgi:hypothetical protein
MQHKMATIKSFGKQDILIETRQAQVYWLQLWAFRSIHGSTWLVGYFDLTIMQILAIPTEIQFAATFGILIHR